MATSAVLVVLLADTGMHHCNDVCLSGTLPWPRVHQTTHSVSDSFSLPLSKEVGQHHTILVELAN